MALSQSSHKRTSNVAIVLSSVVVEVTGMVTLRFDTAAALQERAQTNVQVVSCTVEIVYNDIGYNDEPDITTE